MKMMFAYLKRYLDEGKASVFVGAGFSRNATMPETAEMKDWNMLGMEFYQRLYGCKPSSTDAMFLSPIHLASEVEASFGRNELDNLIIQSLPDDVIVHLLLTVRIRHVEDHQCVRKTVIILCRECRGIFTDCIKIPQPLYCLTFVQINGGDQLLKLCIHYYPRRGAQRLPLVLRTSVIRSSFCVAMSRALEKHLNIPSMM